MREVVSAPPPGHEPLRSYTVPYRLCLCCGSHGLEPKVAHRRKAAAVPLKATVEAPLEWSIIEANSIRRVRRRSPVERVRARSTEAGSGPTEDG